MQKIATIVFKIVMWILLVLLLWVTFGCGGKKKLVQKSEFSTEVVKVERVNELVEKDVVTDITTNTKSESYSITENSDVSLTQADPDKEIILIDPQGRVTKIKGANAVISNRKETMTKKDTFGQNLSKNKLTKNIKKTQTDLKERVISKNKSISKEKQGKFPWWILILIGVVYIAVSIWRKTLNPLGWV